MLCLKIFVTLKSLYTQATAETPDANHEETLKDKLSSFFRRSGEEGSSVKRERHTCLTIIYVILCVVLIIKAVILISVTVSTTVILKLFSPEVSGRVAGMIIIAVAAAVVLTVSIYSMIGCIKRHNRPLHAAALTLLILAIVLAVVVAVSVPVRKADEAHLARDLVDSFRQSRVDPKRWSIIQSEFSCCGVNGPEDYRALVTSRVIGQLPPNVPVSCCPFYNPTKPDILQEAERETCKANREYYKTGCTDPVLDTYKNLSDVVLSISIGFISLMVIQGIVAVVIVQKNNLKPEPQVIELRATEPKAPPPAQPLPQKLKAKLSMT